MIRESPSHAPFRLGRASARRCDGIAQLNERLPLVIRMSASGKPPLSGDTASPPPRSVRRFAATPPTRATRRLRAIGSSSPSVLQVRSVASSGSSPHPNSGKRLEPAASFTRHPADHRIDAAVLRCPERRLRRARGRLPRCPLYAPRLSKIGRVVLPLAGHPRRESRLTALQLAVPDHLNTPNAAGAVTHGQPASASRDRRSAFEVMLRAGTRPAAQRRGITDSP